MDDDYPYGQCCDCGCALLRAERCFYGFRCEQCETDELERIQAWRDGGEDVELDRRFGEGPRQLH